MVPWIFGVGRCWAVFGVRGWAGVEQAHDFFEVVGGADPVPFAADFFEAAQEESSNVHVVF